MSTDDTRYREFIPIIADEDTKRVLKKDEEYGASWKKRGGVGAYMVMIRKVDRLETQCARHGYDIFKALESDAEGSESLLDTIRDLRSYLDLIEADHRASDKAAKRLVRDITMCICAHRIGDHRIGGTTSCSIAGCICLVFSLWPHSYVAPIPQP